MLAPAISKVREFLSSRKNLLALGTLPLLGAWIYSRVRMVNPAILGDEYLYSMNARKVGPWDPPVAGDFSNYLFNFFYLGTHLCGDAFYACGKIFNIVFFLGFILTIFILALRFLPFWGAYAFMIAAALSPLSVYTSMFLPESMYFFFIGLVLVAVLRAMRAFTWQNWALAGAAIGVASLVKPHAWLSAIAVGITMLVVGLFNKEIGFKRTIVAGLGLVAGAALARVVVGLFVAGPKALGFFGQYFGLTVIETVVSGNVETDGDAVTALVGAGPMAGVFGLFTDQLTVHLYVIFALLGLSVLGLAMGMISLMKTRTLGSVEGFSLFAFIWLASMMIEIVMFTGWVTGGGDDHTTRVLLRYYEFLFVIVPLAGLSALIGSLRREVNVWVRWIMAGVSLALITPAFTGFFGTLTIQIADAPTLAGLVVNTDVFNAVALLGVAGLLVFATFPQYSPLVFLLLLPGTMIATGWETQGQYQLFRGADSPADVAGQYVRDSYTGLGEDELLVLATSRFDATNVGIWADIPRLRYELFGPGSVIASGFPEASITTVVVVGNLGFDEEPTFEGEGFKIFELD